MKERLIIDKSVFHATSLEKMKAFVSSHDVVFPYALAVECLISKKDKKKPSKNPVFLLQRLKELVQAGASISYSTIKIFKHEKKSLQPIDSIIDTDLTQMIKMDTLQQDNIREEAEVCKRIFESKIKVIKDIANTFHQNIVKSSQKKHIRDYIQQNDINIRLKNAFEATDEMMDKILQKLLSDQVSSNVTEEWFTWHLIRLMFVWAIEWARKRNNSGSSMNGQDVSNDFYDLQYIACLSRADGLISNDHKSGLRPMAEAAFPGKIFPEI